MDEQRAQQGGEPELKRPEDAIEDLEAEPEDAEGVKGGGIKLGGVTSESLDDTFKSP